MPTTSPDPKQATPYYTVERDRRGFVRITRTSLAYPSLAAVTEDTVKLADVVRRFGERRVLVDFRGGPTARNDDGFEKATERGRRELLGGFDRVAVLVRSAVGILQIKRLSRQDGFEPHIFNDEAAAIAFLVVP